jgi:hypothetical protein
MKLRMIMLVAAASGFLLPLMAVSAQADPVTVALWHMDELEGSSGVPETTVDCAGGDNNGTTSNILAGQAGDPSVTVTDCPPTFTDPQSGNQGYFFDGTLPESVVTVADAANLNPGNSNISFTAHVNFVSHPVATSDYGVVRKGPGRGQHYKMELKPNSTRTRTRARCSFKGSSGKTTITKGPNLINGWHTITCFKDSTQIGVIVDGRTFTKPITIGSITNTSPVTIGRNEDGDDQYHGNMDEVSITIG